MKPVSIHQNRGVSSPTVRRDSTGSQALAVVDLLIIRSSAARAAHRGQARSYICCNAPFQSGHGCSPWCMAEDRWGAGSASRKIGSCQQGWQLWPHRPWHVATNVGAGLPREAPRGRRSISQALKISRQALRDAPRGRRSISRAPKIPRQALRDAPRGRRSISRATRTYRHALAPHTCQMVKAPSYQRRAFTSPAVTASP